MVVPAVAELADNAGPVGATAYFAGIAPTPASRNANAAVVAIVVASARGAKVAPAVTMRLASTSVRTIRATVAPVVAATVTEIQVFAWLLEWHGQDVTDQLQAAGVAVVEHFDTVDNDVIQ
jgi:hypothetical protein